MKLPPLTSPNPTFDAMVKATPVGMASWAGGGPPKATCGGCAHWAGAPRDTKPAICNKAWRLFKRPPPKTGSRIPARTPACRFYESAKSLQ